MRALAHGRFPPGSRRFRPPRYRRGLLQRPTAWAQDNDIDGRREVNRLDMGPGGYLVGVVILLVAAGGSGVRRGTYLAVAGCLSSVGPVKAAALLLLTASLLAFSCCSRGCSASSLGGRSRAPRSCWPRWRQCWTEGRSAPPRPPPGGPSRRQPTSVEPAGAARRGRSRRGRLGGRKLLTVISKPPLAVDFISYDLPVIGHWIQSGSVWHITELFPLQTHGTYPQTADLLLAAFVLPFHNDAFVGLVPFLALGATGLASYCTARELQAPRGAAIVLAAMFCAHSDRRLGGPIGAPQTRWRWLRSPRGCCSCSGTSDLGGRRTSRSRPSGLGFAAGSLWYFSSAVVVIALAWIVLALVPRGLRGRNPGVRPSPKRACSSG